MRFKTDSITPFRCQRIERLSRGNQRYFRFRPLLCGSLLPTQIERAIDQADVTIGLRKVAQHAAGRGIDLFREQAHVIATRQQTGEQLARLLIAALQDVIVDQPEAARQESSFTRG
jgi:hypothetical protein